MIFARTLFSLFFPSTTATSVELQQLLRETHKMSNALETLTREVAESHTVTESAIVLLEGLSDALRDAIEQNNDTAVLALAEQLDKQTAALVTALQANIVPVEPPPVEPPV